MNNNINNNISLEMICPFCSQNMKLEKYSTFVYRKENGFKILIEEEECIYDGKIIYPLDEAIVDGDIYCQKTFTCENASNHPTIFSNISNFTVMEKIKNKE